MERYKHILAAGTAYFIWGFFAFGLKPISHYAAITIMCYRLIFCVIILSIITVLFRRNKVKKDVLLFNTLSKKEKRVALLNIVGGALILLVNWLGFIYVINEVNVQTAGLTYLICPILTAVLSAIVLKEKLGKHKWMAIILSTIACLLLSIGHFKEMYLAILVAMAFAVYLMFQKKLNIFDSFNLLNIQTLVISIVLIPVFLFYTGPIPDDEQFYFQIGIIVSLFTIIPMYLNNFALKKIPTSTAGILIYLNPIVNFLLAIFYYKETVSSLQYIAYGMIVTAIIIYNFNLINTKSNMLPK